MHGQHRERQARRHQQLDVRRVREHVRAERKCHGRDRRAAAIAGQVPHQAVGAGQRQHEGQERDGVVREVRVPAAQPVKGDGEGACTEICLGIRERLAVGIEDVGVVDAPWGHDERARHPRDVPHAELPVARVHAARREHAGRQWPGHDHGDHQGRDTTRSPPRPNGRA